MMKHLKELLTFYDKILIILILFITLSLIIFPFLRKEDNSEEKILVIQNSIGEVIRIDMQETYGPEPMFLEVEGPIGVHLIEVHNGRVRVKEPPEADPYKICEHTGWIDHAGPMIICVPNQLSIWIEEKESDLDGVSW